jgi:hypothetical protein
MYSSAYPRPLAGGGFRLGAFDTSVLTSDVTAALKRGQPSSILAGMRFGGDVLAAAGRSGLAAEPGPWPGAG